IVRLHLPEIRLRRDGERLARRPADAELAGFRAVVRGHDAPAVAHAADQIKRICHRVGRAYTSARERLALEKEQGTREIRVPSRIDHFGVRERHELAADAGERTGRVLNVRLPNIEYAAAVLRGVQDLGVLCRREIDQRTEALLGLVSDAESRPIELKQIVVDIELMDVEGIAVRGEPSAPHFSPTIPDSASCLVQTSRPSPSRLRGHSSELGYLGCLPPRDVARSQGAGTGSAESEFLCKVDRAPKISECSGSNDS